jgi:hypothetical protein
MAETVGPLGFIQSLIGQGVSPTAGLRQYRQAGGAIRTQRWFRAWGEMQAEISTRPVVVAAPLTSVPTRQEITRVESKRPGAYLFRGGVMAFDRQTGEVEIRPSSVRSRTLMRYEEALAAMVEQLASNAEEYDISVVGGFITSVRELVPVGDLE